VHPLEPGKTLLTSFVFNVQLVLLCVLPTVQFTTEAFNTYARLTQASVIFGTQFRYIQGFRFFWQYNVFLFLILAFVLMALMYTYCCPSDRAHITKAINAIKETKNKEFRDFGRKLDQKGGALSLV